MATGRRLRRNVSTSRTLAFNPPGTVVDQLLGLLARVHLETMRHSQRVAHYSASLGVAAGLTEPELRTLWLGAHLHDIGKLRIRREILDKPAKLSADEMALMREHPLRGARICKQAKVSTSVQAIVLYHHERWDGFGYPHGIAGTDIPLLARIVAVADVFDALTTQRPYQNPLAREDAIKVLEDCGGNQLDPELVDLCLSYANLDAPCPSGKVAGNFTDA